MTEDSFAVRLSESEAGLLKQLDSLPTKQLQADLREFVSNYYFSKNGYIRLEGKCGSGNCFDGVYMKGDTIIVNEVKPLNANGSVSLSGNTGTNLGTQMSDQWISDAIRRLYLEGTPETKRTADLMMRAIDQNKLVKVVSAVNSSGINIVKLIGNK